MASVIKDLGEMIGQLFFFFFFGLTFALLTETKNQVRELQVNHEAREQTLKYLFGLIETQELVIKQLLLAAVGNGF